MKNFISRIKRSYILNIISSFYIDEDFELVLKHLKRPFSLKRPDEVICNIFRIISLKETNQNSWQTEYNYFLDEGFLDVFSDEEKEYLKTYLSFRLFGNIEFSVNHSSTNISKRLRNYFPLDFIANESFQAR